MSDSISRDTFRHFQRLPTVLQHLIFSYSPRRSLLSYSQLDRFSHKSTEALVARVKNPKPVVTKREMREWVSRLESQCTVLRHITQTSSCVNPHDLSLLYVGSVPTKEGVTPMDLVPKSRKYTGDEQAPHKRALKQLKAHSEAKVEQLHSLTHPSFNLHSMYAASPSTSHLSPPTAAVSSSNSSAIPTVPLITYPNVSDSLQSTPLTDWSEGGVRKILTNVRWVLNSYRAVWIASLIQRHRQQMEEAQNEHEAKLDRGETSEFDYCELEDRLNAERTELEERWGEEQKDLLFEMRLVLLSLLRFTNQDAAASSMSTSISQQSNIFTRETVHINDPSQDLASQEGVADGRYTCNIFVLPLAKTESQEAEEMELSQALLKQLALEREEAAQAERVKAMLHRFDAPSDKLAQSLAQMSQDKARRVGLPILERIALLRPDEIRREIQVMQSLAIFKGVEVPTELTEMYQEALRTAEERENGLRVQPAADAANEGPAESEGSSSALESNREGFDQPYFFIATSSFRNEKIANNSRRSMSMR